MIKYIFLFSAFCLAMSCASTQKLLCKSWKIDDVQFVDSLNTFTPAQKEMLSKALKTQVTFVFATDSIYKVYSMMIEDRERYFCLGLEWWGKKKGGFIWRKKGI